MTRLLQLNRGMFLVEGSQVPADSIDGYRLLKELGSGGMGAVFLAESIDAPGERVAIKLLYPSLMDDEGNRSRFQREATIAKAMRDERLVATLETGHARGMDYIVMEYIEGEGLDAMLERVATLEPECAVEIIMDAALGLNVLHEHGALHRDIKPANLMVVDGNRVKIADFGLAKRKADRTVTVPNTVFGTVAYMAPEQLDPAAVIDIRVDIYALGVTLFQMLTGRTPFEDENPQRALSLKTLQDCPDPRLFEPAIPGWLARIVLKMCARHPGQRYRTPMEIIEALRDYRTGSNETERISNYDSEPIERTDIDHTGPVECPTIVDDSLREVLRNQTEIETMVKVKKGEFLFLEGDREKDLYILLKGTLRVAQAGKYLSTCGRQGEVLGELSYLLNCERTATIMAEEDSVLLKVAEGDYAQALEQNPRLSMYLLKRLAERFVESTTELGNLRKSMKKLQEISSNAAQGIF